MKISLLVNRVRLFIYISWAVGRIRPFFLEENMAISKGSGDIPYVHSNAENFKNRTGVANYSKIGSVIRPTDIESAIQILWKIRNQLKLKAEEFMGSSDINTELLKTSNTYSGIATKIIQSYEMAHALITPGALVSSEKIQQLLQGQECQKEIMEKLDPFGKDIPIEQVTSIFMDSFPKTIKGEIDVTGTRLQDFFHIDEKKLQRWAGNHTYQYYAEPCCTEAWSHHVLPCSLSHHPEKLIPGISYRVRNTCEW